MQRHRGEGLEDDVVAALRAVCSIVAVAVCGCGGGSASAPTPATPLVVTSADLTPSQDGGPATIKSPLLEPHRVSGDHHIVPDGATITAVAKSGIRLIGAFKLCLDVEGRATSVEILKTTGVASYDQKIISSLRAWVFTPVVLDAEPIPVCSAFTFIFSAR